MYNFKYVTKKQLSLVKQDLIQIINTVQNQVRKDFTFQFYFVGSVERNMVSYDVKSNVGFDFDSISMLMMMIVDLLQKKLRQKLGLRLIRLHLVSDMIMLKIPHGLLQSNLKTGKIQKYYIVVILP